MPVTGDTIVKLADGSRIMVCHLQPEMTLDNDVKIVTITVQRFTGWLYTVGPHFITTGTTLIDDNKQMSKNIATKRIYTTTNIYDFVFDGWVGQMYPYGSTRGFWCDIATSFNSAQFQTIQLPDEIEHDPDSKVYRRIWDAESKTWQHELVE